MGLPAQYTAKGHPAWNNGQGGRPPIDRDKMADDIIQWAESSEALDIKQWRIKHKISYEMVSILCETSVKFFESYRYAFDCIALRRWEMNHTDELKDSLYSQHLKVYDKDRAEADEISKDRQLDRDLRKLEKEIQLRAMGGGATEDEKEKLASIYSLVDQLQTLSSKRKSADTNIKDDTKS